MDLHTHGPEFYCDLSCSDPLSQMSTVEKIKRFELLVRPSFVGNNWRAGQWKGVTWDGKAYCTPGTEMEAETLEDAVNLAVEKNKDVPVGRKMMLIDFDRLLFALGLALLMQWGVGCAPRLSPSQDRFVQQQITETQGVISQMDEQVKQEAAEAARHAHGFVVGETYPCWNENVEAAEFLLRRTHCQLSISEYCTVEFKGISDLWGVFLVVRNRDSLPYCPRTMPIVVEERDLPVLWTTIQDQKRWADAEKQRKEAAEAAWQRKQQAIRAVLQGQP